MSTYTPIATQTLSGSTSSVTFSSLPQNYTDLIVQVNNQMSGASGIKIRFNSDAGSNYSMTTAQGYGSTKTSYRATNATSIYNNLVYGDSTTANAFTPHIMQIQNYSNSSTYKTMLWKYGSSTQAGGNGDLAAIVGVWRNTSAITSIEISAWNAVNFVAGSTFTIYGIAAGNSSAKASGGNIVTTDGTYWYHTFTSSGTFIPSTALTCDYLVVAGGGGGGGWQGGGGGAGGLRCTVGATGGGGSLESALSLTANTVYQAIVGAGGAGTSYPVIGDNAANGSNSIFSTITSLGGGFGGGNSLNGIDAATGGSGGGRTYGNGGGLGTTNQGYNGGNNYQLNPYNGGGGGGAGTVGGNASSSNGGAGGTGISTSISGSSIYYAGGGGGGTAGNNNSSRTGGTGGTGGGGAGGNSTGTGSNSSGTGSAGTNGTVSLGAGGGGAGYGTNSGSTFGGAGGNGGSGVIIIRYAV